MRGTFFPLALGTNPSCYSSGDKAGSRGREGARAPPDLVVAQVRAHWGIPEKKFPWGLTSPSARQVKHLAEVDGSRTS